jgi:hypothetical protein
MRLIARMKVNWPKQVYENNTDKMNKMHKYMGYKDFY